MFTKTGLRRSNWFSTMPKAINRISLLCLVLSFAHASAAGYQSIDSIKQSARQFVETHTRANYGQQGDIEVGRLDSRLKLNQCQLPLEAYLPTGSRDLGRFTVGIRCNDERPWSIHVPVTVAVYQDVIVITKPLPRGTILEQENMRVMKYDMSQLPAGYVEDQQDAVGMELTRRLASDTPLTTNLIRKPKIIKRGQQVSIIARSGGMEVRMMGKALEHGAVGERIRVQNLRSKKKVEGTVTPSGDVRVDI